MSARAIQLGDNQIDLDLGRLYGPEGETELTALEVRVLSYLLQRRGRLVSRAELEREIWGFHPKITSEAVPACIRRLRHKLEGEREARILLTHRGRGWSIPSVCSPDERPTPIAAPPIRQDTLIGRQQELRALEATEARLVTLVGFGGIGKSRLALRYASDASLSRFAGGVVFCDLNHATSLSDALHAIGEGAGLSIQGQDPLGRLSRTFAARGRCLLVLDNTTTIASSVADIASRLLALTNELSLLITSRSALGIAEEHVIRLGGLNEADAVALLMERVSRINATPPTDSGTATRLVQLLDGHPLAIELAAHQCRILSVEDITVRLREQMSKAAPALASEWGGVWSALEWSFDLLDRPLQTALARVSVFEEAFDLEALEEMIGEPTSVNTALALLDAGFFRKAGTGQHPKFDCAPLVRSFARMRLERLEGVLLAERKHGQYFARLGTPQAMRALRGPSAEPRKRLREQRKDLVAACRRAILRGDAAVASACFIACWSVLVESGPPGLGLELAEQIEVLQDLSTNDRSRVQHALAEACEEESRALLLYESALEGFRQAQDRPAIIETLRLLSGICQSQGQHERSEELLVEAEAIVREVDDPVIEADVRIARASNALRSGQIERARRLAEEVLAIRRRVSDRRGEGIVSRMLAGIELRLGDPERAAGMYDEALAIHREVGNLRSEAIQLGQMVTLAERRGRSAEAIAHTEAALALHRQLGNRQSEAIAWINLSLAAAARGDTQTARRQIDEGVYLLKEIGNRLSLLKAFDTLGHILMLQGRIEESREVHRQALTEAIALHQRVHQGRALLALGWLLAPERFEEALSLFDEGIACLRSAGEPVRALSGLSARGWLLVLVGEDRRAEADFTEVIALGQAHGARFPPLAVAWAGRALLLGRSGDASAEPLARHALEMARASGHVGVLAQVLLLLAERARICGRLEEARRHLADADPGARRWGIAQVLTAIRSRLH